MIEILSCVNVTSSQDVCIRMFISVMLSLWAKCHHHNLHSFCFMLCFVSAFYTILNCTELYWTVLYCAVLYIQLTHISVSSTEFWLQHIWCYDMTFPVPLIQNFSTTRFALEIQLKIHCSASVTSLVSNVFYKSFLLQFSFFLSFISYELFGNQSFYKWHDILSLNNLSYW